MSWHREHDILQLDDHPSPRVFFFFIPALFRFNVKVGHALWSPPKLNYLNARGFDRVRTHRDKSASCRSPSKGQWITRSDVEFSRNFSARWIFVSWHMERPSPTGCQFFSSISLWIVFIRLLQLVSSLQDSLLTSSVLRSAYLVSKMVREIEIIWKNEN